MAVMGSTLMMLLMILCGLGVGIVLVASPSESSFVAACLSLSSTPLVVKFLTPASSGQDEDSKNVVIRTFFKKVATIIWIYKGYSLCRMMLACKLNDGQSLRKYQE